MSKQLPKSIRIYALTVCFASMLVGSVSLTIAAYDMLQYFFPKTMHPHIEQQLVNATDRMQERISAIEGSQELTAEQKEVLVNQRIGIAASQPQRFGYEHFRNVALQSLISSALSLLIACVVFFFHWRLATRSEFKDNA